MSELTGTILSLTLTILKALRAVREFEVMLSVLEDSISCTVLTIKKDGSRKHLRYRGALRHYRRCGECGGAVTGRCERGVRAEVSVASVMTPGAMDPWTFTP